MDNKNVINYKEHKFDEDWTEKQDKDLKSYHECDWEETCVMCQNYDNCNKEAIEAQEMNYLADLADKS